MPLPTNIADVADGYRCFCHECDCMAMVNREELVCEACESGDHVYLYDDDDYLEAIDW